jgi:hypothetical protein
VVTPSRAIFKAHERPTAAALDAFTKIVRKIRVIRLIVDGEHCMAMEM